jgi:hypothetical protein
MQAHFHYFFFSAPSVRHSFVLIVWLYHQRLVEVLS